MLATNWLSEDRDPAQPVLVFLHGLLGSSQDWLPIIPYLKQYACLGIDLPGHGGSRHIAGQNFDHTCQLIDNSLQNVIAPDRKIVLIGYSLGARLAMYGVAQNKWPPLRLVGCILEGGNFGLTGDNDKQTRWKNDKAWAQRFASQPIEQVLADWYQQAVFKSLNQKQTQALIAKRTDNSGEMIAEMLQATSLAKQPYLLHTLQQLSTLRVHYVCGELDSKFTRLAQSSKLFYSQIAQAGHNVHQEQPQAFAQVVQQVVAKLN